MQRAPTPFDAAVIAKAEGGHHLDAWKATYGTDELPEAYR